MPVCLSLCVYLCLAPFLSLPLSPSLLLSLHLSFCLSLWPSLSICLFSSPLLSLSTCPSLSFPLSFSFSPCPPLSLSLPALSSSQSRCRFLSALADIYIYQATHPGRCFVQRLRIQAAQGNHNFRTPYFYCYQTS